jgi:ATP-dependent DNA ligase
MDGELIAAGANGQPDFLALLHGRRVPVCVYAFDLIELWGAICAIRLLSKGELGSRRCLPAAKAT